MANEAAAIRGINKKVASKAVITLFFIPHLNFFGWNIKPQKGNCNYNLLRYSIIFLFLQKHFIIPAPIVRTFC
jgi:hypothetical protein